MLRGFLSSLVLLSAAVATLVSVSRQALRPNPQPEDTSAFYPENIYQLFADPNVTSSSIIATRGLAKPPAFSPPKYAVLVTAQLGSESELSSSDPRPAAGLSSPLNGLGVGGATTGPRGVRRPVQVAAFYRPHRTWLNANAPQDVPSTATISATAGPTVQPIPGWERCPASQQGDQSSPVLTAPPPPSTIALTLSDVAQQTELTTFTAH